MGATTVTLTLRNPDDPTKTATGQFLVDSGAHYTVIPQQMVKRLALKPAFNQKFSLADGRIVTRAIGSAVVTLEGRELPAPVVLGQKDDSALLGVTTLETFGLMLDPFRRNIYPSKLILA
jgi:clan AA aspartic protease